MNIAEAIRKLNSVTKNSLSEEQKDLVVKILKNAPKDELNNWFKFLIQRVKLGFVFDAAPEIDYKRIALINELKIKNINSKHNPNVFKHKLIVGENYDALKNLVLTYQEEIDCIYIDPPYNTEGALKEGNVLNNSETYKNKFVYRDKFIRTGWLNMMQERLTLAHQLLRGGGRYFYFNWWFWTSLFKSFDGWNFRRRWFYCLSP